MHRNAIVTVTCVVALAMARTNASGQTQYPVARGQVQCELRALEGAGYRPWENDYYYPKKLQAAQAKLAQQEKERGLPPGGSCTGTNESGAVTSRGRDTGQ